MVISKRIAWFFIAFGVWSWVIWPVFLKNIWKDSRSWHHGMTGFFAVHLVLTVVSLVLGTAIGILGIRAAQAFRFDLTATPGGRKRPAGQPKG
jgi:hypothetical protein